MSSFRLGWGWYTIAGVLIVGLLIGMLGHLRAGGIVMAFALFAGCALRAFMPKEYVPALVVRSRAVDCLVFALFGIVTLVGFASVRL